MATSFPFPYMPPRSTDQLLSSLDEYQYFADPTTVLYKYVDAMVGTTGAGDLLNQLFMATLGTALETIYFNDLDYIFGNMNFIARTSAESYAANPHSALLTSDDWDQIRIADAWYRARIKDFFVACGLGGTPEGVRECIQAAVAVDCDLFEVWRYEDNFGLGANLGRAPFSARNEIVVRPHKDTLSPVEARLCRDMLSRLVPIETVVTVSLDGLAVAVPIPIANAASDSTYFEVQKVVTATPLISQLPPPEFLPIDLLPTEQWMFPTQEERDLDISHSALAPYAAFNITQEYGYYYLVGGGKRSPIDSVTYGTLRDDGSVQTESNYEVYSTSATYTDWKVYDKCDSPDNYPGGKFGKHPDYAPAIGPDSGPYNFPFASQADYVEDFMSKVLGMGGIADDLHYKLPIQKPTQAKQVFWPSNAVAYFPPAKASTISKSITRQRGQSLGEGRDPGIFVRS